ncbi:MAG: glycosyltransferase family 2 protein [Rhodospirillales bacterium]|nr:glycosyltransferase family 2 protein [Rhodospirillales bacterium]MBO6788072.1 glycosyltransferase family 2 protein [Rhodospirillales bacterium]
MTKLSALVVAHNEEIRLDACLARLGFAGEIVVVLDRCTDASKQIAAKHGAKILEGAWPVEGERRHAGIDACAGPWILEVDADEWIEQPLADEITSAVRADDADFYFTPIHNYVGERWVRYGWMAALAPDLRGSLFRKGHKTWGMERVHPGVSFTGRRGPDFKNGVRHNFVVDVADLLKRFNRNTTLKAEDAVARGETARTCSMARKALSRFWKCYVARKGHREGGVGLVIAILCALYPLVAHLKAEEIRESSEGR